MRYGKIRIEKLYKQKNTDIHRLIISRWCTKEKVCSPILTLYQQVIRWEVICSGTPLSETLTQVCNKKGLDLKKKDHKKENRDINIYNQENKKTCHMTTF
jgi:hypothetical protein